MDDLFVAPRETTIGRFVVRSWRPGDGAALAAATAVSRDHLAPWLPWAAEARTPESVEVDVRRLAGQYLTLDDFVLSIWDGDELVGGTGLHPRWGGRASRVAEIGMWVASDRAGRGVGTTILRGLVSWGLSDVWCWDRFVWLCDPRNVASARVAAKAAFTLEGNLRGPAPNGHGRDATLVWGFNRADAETAP